MAKGTVLLVEDNAVNQMIIEEYLSGQGLEVHTADDGEQAVEKAFFTAFDLILMDLEMPNMDGKEAVVAIRAANGYAPIIALTGHEKEGKVKQLRQAGFNGFVQKPVTEAQLKEIVDNFLNL